MPQALREWEVNSDQVDECVDVCAGGSGRGTGREFEEAGRLGVGGRQCRRAAARAAWWLAMAHRARRRTCVAFFQWRTQSGAERSGVPG